MTTLHRPRRLATTLRVAAGSAVVLAVATALAPGAAADPFSDGQWYVGPFKLAANHAIADGTGVTVAVLDGVFSPSAPSLAGADVVPPPPSGCVGKDGSTAVTATTPRANHATQMVAMIAGQGGANVPVGVAPGAKVLTYTVGIGTDTDPELACKDLDTSDRVTAAAINDAVAKGARIVSMSFSDDGPRTATETAILFGERKGVVFVASTDDAASVTGSRLRQPAVYNGVVAVNGINPEAKLIEGSATGDPDGPLVVASAPGDRLTLGGYQPGQGWNATTYISGSSPATAFVAGVLAATASKWPKATGNQLIQSLARNTGGTEHGVDQRALDGYGYGVVSLTSMLAHDPTTYPDENPTLRDDADPSTGDILDGSTSASSSSSSTPPSTGGSSAAPGSSSPSQSAVAAPRDGGGVPVGLVIAIVAGVVVVVAVVLLVVVLTRRGRRPGPPPPTPGPPPYAAGGSYR